GTSGRTGGPPPPTGGKAGTCGSPIRSPPPSPRPRRRRRGASTRNSDDAARPVRRVCPTKATDGRHSDRRFPRRGDMAMIRATVVRALVLTAAFGAALTPVTCLGEDSSPLPAKATKAVPPELLSLFRQKKMPKNSPILVRVFKEEAELEVWKQDTAGRFQLLKIYPICRWSGDLGPK